MKGRYLDRAVDSQIIDFRLSARVTVDFRATFDAGVLLLWLDEAHWAKLCFEYTPDGRLAWSWQSRLDNETNGRTFEASVLPASMDREFFEERLAACAS